MSSVIKRKPKPNAPASATDASISKATKKLKGILDAMKGTDAEPVPMPRGAPSPALMYKLMGKIFAILSVRGEAFVIVKCDPSHADLLRQSYGGIGHRSHLDRRFWISIDLDSDVPMDEIRKLIAGSYDLIYASLTRKQKEEFGSRH